MHIQRNATTPSTKGSPDYFTGPVRIDSLFQTPDPARVAIATVTFEPGSRTAWHTHPLGQTLIITSGRGWAQTWGGQREELNPVSSSTSLPTKSTGTAQPPQEP